MKKILIIILLIVSQSGFSQGTNKASVFHRLLIYNSENEIMLVKVKGADVWVTPGFYQDTIQFIKQGLRDVASTYGIKISEPKLTGVFSMKRETGKTKEMLIRNIYKCNYQEGEIHFPENQPFTISEIKWVTIGKALKILTHTSVQLFVKQTHNNPNIVSGGSIIIYNENNKVKAKIIEEFYPLFSSEKRSEKRECNK